MLVSSLELMVFVAYLYTSRMYLHSIDNAWYLKYVQARAFTGCIIADSFLSQGGYEQQEAHREIITRILQHWNKTHGRIYFLLCIPGASFTGHKFRTYATMICRMAPMQHILWIAMGNDLYDKDYKQQQVFDAARSCFEAIAPYARLQTLVFGGSSCVWQYTGSFAGEYDIAVKTLILRFRTEISCLNAVHDGVDLAGIRTTDRIGHVDWSHEASMRIIEAYFSDSIWTNAGSGSLRSRL